MSRRPDEVGPVPAPGPGRPGAHSEGPGAAPPPGRLLVLAGPSGVGKSTVVGELRRIGAPLWFSVSATTREMRPGEVDGRDYHFVDRPEFQRMVDDDELLEWAEIHRGMHRSGTPRAPVDAHLRAGEPVLLELDLAGARAVRQRRPDALFVFLKPPSWDVLVERLTARGTEAEEVVARRLATARVELAALSEFDVTLVNRDVGATARRLVELSAGPGSPLRECASSHGGNAPEADTPAVSPRPAPAGTGSEQSSESAGTIGSIAGATE